MSTSVRTEGKSELRLFVPLAKGPFRWFEEGRKQWELRKYGRQYTERHVKAGKRIELRYGYNSHRSLWGFVRDTITAQSIADFFSQVDYRLVIPTAESRDEAIQIANEILKIRESEIAVFAFRVELDRC
jgi:hypothetical protein